MALAILSKGEVREPRVGACVWASGEIRLKKKEMRCAHLWHQKGCACGVERSSVATTQLGVFSILEIMCYHVL